MKKAAWTAVLLFLVLMLVTSMTAAAAAAKPAFPGEPAGKKGSPPGGGGAKPSQAEEKFTYVYAGDQGWQKEGAWYLERYTQLPPPLTGEADLLVSTETGAAATYSIPAGHDKVQVFSAKYWTCGVMEIYLDGALVSTVDLYSETTIWKEGVYTGKIDPSVSHTLAIKVKGEGGPGPIEVNGEVYNFYFVNVNYLKLRTA